MSHLWREISSVINRMGMHEWTLALAAMILVAVFCMRGFGSRSKY
jgi:hypothetical protein